MKNFSIEQATTNRSLTVKFPYVTPRCKVIKTEAEGFICVSVRPDANGSQDNGFPWGEQEHNGGSIGFGDESSIAPSKKGIWDYDEEEEY